MKKEDLKSPEFKHSQAVKSFRIGGRDFDRIPCGYEQGEWYGIEDHCSNCGMLTGFLHHLPCDLEQCPRCKGQALSCNCKYEKRPGDLAIPDV